ncbi:LicD family-domain-containing protein [Chytriomyces sp. MP71]|nr:LicD family-domain-containing protein [Chytriomyces sp. MP71]
MLLSIHPNHSIGFDFRVAEATEDPQFDDQFPLSHFRDSFQQIAKRLASYDTGRTLTIPYEHFGLQQPAPPFPLNVPKAMEDGLSNAKYFHECGRDKKRDLRFADASCLVREPSPTGRVHRNKQTQHNLKLAHESLKGILQSWSEFAGANDIRWWISHGNLLGWFWNARFLPWDVDLDIQMSTFQLIQLIPHNNTLLANRYLLEVNPAFAHRTPQPGNTIDARVTDTHTGYLMDITALTQFDASDARVHCKTPHPFRYEELMPLRETRLEGVTVWRPNRVISILAEEYRVKSMVEIRFSVGSRIMYQWHPNQGEWVLKKG